MRNFLLYCTVIFMWSCSHGSSTSDNNIQQPEKCEFNNVVSLSASDSIQINNVFEIAGNKIVDNSICIMDRSRNNPILNIYSCEDGHKIQSGLKYGNGPDEFIAFNYGDACKSNHIAGYDIMRKRLFLYDIDKQPFVSVSEYDLPLDEEGRAHPYTFISQYNDSIFLLKMDSNDSSEWHLVNLQNGNILWKQTNRVRDPKEYYTPFNYHQHITDSTLLTCYKYMDLVEFYNISTDSLTFIRSYGSLKNQAKIDDYENLNYFYLGITCGKNIFYCLKSVDGTDMGTVIETYDKNNFTPIIKYIIDKPVRSIMYDNTYHRLVGYSPQEEHTKFYMWEI